MEVLASRNSEAAGEVGLKRSGVIRCVVISLFFLGGSTTNVQASPKEVRTRAKALFSLAGFMTWPDSAFEGAAFVIGVLGDDPVGDALEKKASRNQAGTRSIEVKRFSNGTNGEIFRSCQLLFISESETNQLATILEGLSGTTVISVSNIHEFPS